MENRRGVILLTEATISAELQTSFVYVQTVTSAQRNILATRNFHPLQYVIFFLPPPENKVGYYCISFTLSWIKGTFILNAVSVIYY